MYPETDAEKELVREAAPDLYQALKGLFNALDVDEDIWDRFGEEMEKAGNALNKAIGEYYA